MQPSRTTLRLARMQTLGPRRMDGPKAETKTKKGLRPWQAKKEGERVMCCSRVTTSPCCTRGATVPCL